MPIPTENAFRRTGRAVEFFESLRRNRDTVAPTLHEGLRELQWVKLGGDVYGTVTASGTIETWSVSANGYNASSFTVTVRDTTTLLFGASGNWVLCRPSVQSGSPRADHGPRLGGRQLHGQHDGRRVFDVQHVHRHDARRIDNHCDQLVRLAGRHRWTGMYGLPGRSGRLPLRARRLLARTVRLSLCPYRFAHHAAAATFVRRFWN